MMICYIINSEEKIVEVDYNEFMASPYETIATPIFFTLEEAEDFLTEEY